MPNAYNAVVLRPTTPIRVESASFGPDNTIVKLETTSTQQDARTEDSQVFYTYHPLTDGMGDEAMLLARMESPPITPESPSKSEKGEMKSQIASLIASWDPSLTGEHEKQSVSSLFQLLEMHFPDWSELDDELEMQVRIDNFARFQGELSVTLPTEVQQQEAAQKSLHTTPEANRSASGLGGSSRNLFKRKKSRRNKDSGSFRDGPGSPGSPLSRVASGGIGPSSSESASAATRAIMEKMKQALDNKIKETFLVMAIRDFARDKNGNIKPKTTMMQYARAVEQGSFKLKWYHLLIYAHFFLKRPIMFLHAERDGKMSTPSTTWEGAIEGDKNVTYFGIELSEQHPQQDPIVFVCRSTTHFEPLSKISRQDQITEASDSLSITRLNRLPSVPGAAAAASRGLASIIKSKDSNASSNASKNRNSSQAPPIEVDYKYSPMRRFLAKSTSDTLVSDDDDDDENQRRVSRKEIDAKIQELMAPDSAEMSQEYDVPQALIDFVTLMKSADSERPHKGNRKDVTLKIKSAVNLLQEYTQNSDSMFSNNMILNVVGDQSSGKTTITNALTKQTSFFVSATTGTRARTLIRTARDTRVPTSRCHLKFANTEYGSPDMSESEMSKLYMQLTDKIRKESNFTTNNFAITITHNRDDLGITVMDHPGINYQADTTRSLTEDTIKRNFGSRPKGSDGSKGLLLLVVNGRQLPADMQTVTFHRFMDLDEVRSDSLVDRFFIAVTMMDAIADPYKGLAVFQPYADAVRSFVDPESNDTEGVNISIDYEKRRVTATPKQLYEGMKSKLTNARDTKNRKTLPDHSKVFFVALCDRDTARLQEQVRESASIGQKLDTYELFQDYQRKNNELMVKTLTDVERWAHFGIDVDLGGRDPNDRASWSDLLEYFGIDNLLDHLWERQLAASLRLVVETRKDLDKKVKVMDHLITEIETRLKMMETPSSGLTREFLRTFHDLFNDLSRGTKPSNSSGQLQANFIRRLEELTNQGKLGWTLEEEQQLAEVLLGQDLLFPHGATTLPFLQSVDDEEEVERIVAGIGSLVDHKLLEYIADADFYHTNLHAMLSRLEREFLYRLQATPMPTVDKELGRKFVEDAPPGDLNGTKLLDRPLSEHIASVFRTMFSSGWEDDKDDDNASERTFLGANLFLAKRVAVAHLLQAHAVLAVLPSLQPFRALFLQNADDDDDQSTSEDHNDGDDDMMINIMSHSGIEMVQRYSMELNSQVRDKCKPYAKVKMNNAEDPIMLTSFHDFIKAASSGSHGSVNVLPEETSSPKKDIVAAVIAHFFDRPFKSIRDEMDKRISQIERMSMDSLLPMSIDMAPVFLFHDPKFLETYGTRNKMDSTLTAFAFQDEKAHLEAELQRFNIAYSNVAAALRRSEISMQSGTSPKQVTRLEQLTVNPYKYPLLATEFEDHFRTLRKNSHILSKFMKPLNSIESFDIPNEFAKSDIVVSLKTVNVAPDMAPVTHSKTEPTNFELESIAYVYKRRFSSMTYLAMQHAMTSMNSTIQSFSESSEKDRDSEELFSRVCSLFLGYPYPFARHERPAHLSHLDPDNIIPFLKRNVHGLVSEHSKENVSPHILVVLPHEMSYLQSPLVRHIIRLSQTKPVEALGLIIGLYNTAYPSSKLRDNTQDQMIMAELSKVRYSSDYHTKLNNLYETLKRHRYNWKNISNEFDVFQHLAKGM